MVLTHKKIISSQSGSISLVALPLFALLIIILFSNVATSLREYDVIKFKNKSYICAKKSVRTYNDYYKRISYFNIAIAVAFIAKKNPLTPYLIPVFETVIRLSQLSQSLYKLYHSYKLTTIEECNFLNIAMLMTKGPLKMKGIKIQRRFNGTAKFKEEWDATLPFYYKNSNFQENHSFIIKLDFKLKEKLWTQSFTLNSKEETIKGLRQLRRSYGLHF